MYDVWVIDDQGACRFVQLIDPTEAIDTFYALRDLFPEHLISIDKDRKPFAYARSVK